MTFMGDFEIGNDFWFGANENLNIKLINKGLKVFSELNAEMRLLKGDTPIFLDTNVLTHYYKISFSEREKLRKFIEKHQTRIVLTRQVEKEFIKNRTGIIRKFNDKLKDSLVNKFNVVKKSVEKLQAGKINGLDEYINDKVIKNDFPELSKHLEKIYDNFKDIISKAFESSKIDDKIKLEEDKIDKIIKEATRENNAHEKNDKIISLLADIDVCKSLDKNVIEFLEEKYNELIKIYNLNKASEKDAWQYTFPGCGEKKDKANPTGDFIIFHEILKYMKDKKSNAIFLTNDVSKNDWLDKNKEQYTHYIERAYSNTNQMIFIFHAEDVLEVSYENVFEEEKKHKLIFDGTQDRGKDDFEELSEREIEMMFFIDKLQNDIFITLSIQFVRSKLKEQGINKLSGTVIIRGLLNKGMLEMEKGNVFKGDRTTVFKFTQKGESWLFRKRMEAEFLTDSSNQDEFDDGLPF